MNLHKLKLILYAAESCLLDVATKQNKLDSFVKTHRFSRMKCIGQIHFSKHMILTFVFKSIFKVIRIFIWNGLQFCTKQYDKHLSKYNTPYRHLLVGVHCRIRIDPVRKYMFFLKNYRGNTYKNKTSNASLIEMS